MAVWLPILKTALPYVTQIVTTAIPAFTSKPEVSKVDPIVSKQIEELQFSVTKNSESIQVLAEKLQQTIQGIESAAASLQEQAALFRILLFAVSAIATVALVLAAWALVR